MTMTQRTVEQIDKELQAARNRHQKAVDESCCESEITELERIDALLDERLAVSDEVAS